MFVEETKTFHPKNLRILIISHGPTGAHLFAVLDCSTISALPIDLVLKFTISEPRTWL